LSSESPLDCQPDTALIARYVAVRDEEAFRELVRRHGTMVLCTCVRILRHRQDAEDAFQAVFIILASRSRSLRRVRSLGGWLHNVAVRVSYGLLRGNRRRTRRWFATRREQPSLEVRDRVHELQEVLDQELTALPAKYREAIVLCDLEGHTREEAARILKVSAGTIATWVARGRRRLRDRLVRRGVSLGAGGLAAAAAQWAAGAPQITPQLVQQTLLHAELFLLAGAKVTGTAAAAKITSLAQGELNKMFLTKLSTTVGIVALVAAFLLGASPVSQMLGLLPSLRAAQVFLDDFNDGSITDGNPVKWIVPSWIPNGQANVQTGDLVLTPTDVLPSLPGYDTSYSEMDVLADGVNMQDISLRTRVRGLSPPIGSVPYSIGITARDTLSREFVTGSYLWAAIDSDGVIAVGYALDNVVNGPGMLADIAPRVPTGLNFVAEDVNLQLDVVGNQARFTAWGVSRPKPQAPQIVGTLPNSLAKSGTVVLFGFPPASDWNQPVAFRYVEVVAIPEPSSMALGSLSAFALASFAFRSRLRRIRG
jgi:RNA polymerase sigma factor (sigma-70 family)